MSSDSMTRRDFLQLATVAAAAGAVVAARPAEPHGTSVLLLDVGPRAGE